MAQGLQIQGSSGVVLDVDDVGNVKGVLSQSPTRYGGALLATLNDDGTSTGARSVEHPWTSDDFRLSVGLDTPLAQHTFQATAQDTAKWRFLSTTMTAAQASSILTLNNSLTATTSTGCALYSWQQFPLQLDGSLFAQVFAAISAAPLANQVALLGLGTPASAIAEPADGVWFQLTTAGLIGVVKNAGVTTQTGVLVAAASITVGKVLKYAFIVSDRSVSFWLDDQLLGTVVVPDGQAAPYASRALPIFFQQFNSGTVSGSPQMQIRIAADSVMQLDTLWGRPAADILAGMGLTAAQGQEGNTVGSTASMTNSQATGAGAALTNTTALVTGLGGQAAIQPTLTAGTDGIVCSFQVPVGSTSAPQKSLVIRGVRVHSAVASALTGGPVVWAYSLAFGHTAASLATAETGSFVTATTKAPRRVPIGFESIAATAAAGVLGSPAGVDMKFAAPIVVNPGEFVALVAKNVGTVTSGGVVLTLVAFDAHWV